MSKTRLDEGTIRRFMKLANMEPLSDKVISEMDYARDDEALPGAEEDPMAGEEAAVEDAGVEEEPAPKGDIDVLGLVNAIADAITDETGVEVTASEDEGGEEEAEMPEPEPEAELGGGEEPEAGAPMMEVEQDLEAANVHLDMTTGLVNEVTRRVARRLLRDSAKNR